MFLLDINICIYAIKRRPPEVFERFEEAGPHGLGISVVTLAELQYGVARSSARKRNQRVVDAFVSRLAVEPWDTDAARNYGELRADLARRGKPIVNMDLLIAAHAVSLEATLVTNNLREFNRIRGLKTANWV